MSSQATVFSLCRYCSEPLEPYERGSCGICEDRGYYERYCDALDDEAVYDDEGECDAEFV